MKRVEQLSRGGVTVKTERCGCISPARRTCPACNLTGTVFLACSHACLSAHQKARHGDAITSGTAAIDHIAAVNRTKLDWDAFAGHRGRLTRIATAAQRADGLCVLGAGYAHDLDLPALCRAFGRVHLVDVDAAALAAVHAALPDGLKPRVIVHGGIDLTGSLARIDAWGDRFPNLAERTALVAQVPQNLVQQIGGGFDVVMSACVLTQLGLAFKETLVLAKSDWELLDETLLAIHVGTMAALLRPGGTGLLATEIASSRATPDLFVRVAARSASTADAIDAEALSHGSMIAAEMAARRQPGNPDPDHLLAWLARPPIGGLVERPRALPRWLWDAGNTLALVAAVLFGRRDDD